MEIVYFIKRENWRDWLQEHFDKKEEIWLKYPKKASGEPRIVYNDAVEEALCFGWIDSTVKALDETATVQRFSKRRAKSSFSQANKERLKWLLEHEMIHPSQLEKVTTIVEETFVFPQDIIKELKKDAEVWANYQKFSPPYQRIRIAYIEGTRKRPDEFEKRLNNFITKTKQNKQIKGFGGIDKYYKLA